MSRSSIIPTRSRVPAVLEHLNLMVKLLCVGALLGGGIGLAIVGLMWVLGLDPATGLQRAYEAGREAATSEAMESIGEVVGSAYATGYRTGLQATCQQGAPL